MRQSGPNIWVGIDWSDQSHDVCVLDAERGDTLGSFVVAHDLEGLDRLACELADKTVLGIAIESTRHVIVDALLQKGFTVYAINPKVSDAWRNCWKVQAPKSNSFDAWALAFGLRAHSPHLTPLLPDDPQTKKLRLLVEDEMKLIGQQTELICQLKDTVKKYFPGLLDWFSDWASPTASEFLLRFPTPESLIRAQEKTIYHFLKTHRIGYTRPIWKERMARRKTLADWPVDRATIEAKSLLAVQLATQLKALRNGLKEYRKQVLCLFEQQRDAQLFQSLPGAGEKLAPRLLAFIGSERTRFESASSIQRLSGTVPVTKTTGKKKKNRRKDVCFRWACQKRLRTTLHLFAQCSTHQSRWARVCYEQARARGQSHSLALRNLAAKWIKIIYRMWMTGEMYDEERYVQELIRRGSPVGVQIAQERVLLAASGATSLDPS